jgi:hypothetical protein
MSVFLGDHERFNASRRTNLITTQPKTRSQSGRRNEGILDFGLTGSTALPTIKVTKPMTINKAVGGVL